MTQSNVIALEPKRLVRAMRLELAKPLDRSWDELGTVLRTQRSVIHLLCQAASDALTACRVVGTEATKFAVAPNARAKSPDGIAYQAALNELASLRALAAGKWAWSAERQAALQFSGGAISAISRRVSQELAAWRKDRAAKGKPSYTRGQPIAVRKQEARLLIQDGGAVLDLKLLSEGRFRIATRRTSGRNWDALRRLAALDPEYQMGDVKLIHDERRSKWYAIIAYSAPVPERPDLDPDRVLVVHRGLRNALTWADSSGGLSYIERGNKLRAQLARVKARRREMAAVRAHRGSGAKGHGLDRRFAAASSLEDLEQRIWKTFWQQNAARIVKLAIEHGCGTVVLEDYGGIEPSEDRGERRFLERGPLYMGKQCIAWAVKREGLALREVDGSYISTECPRCKRRDERCNNTRTGVFHCIWCTYERPTDYVSALHMLRRSGGDISVWDKRWSDELKLAEREREET